MTVRVLSSDPRAWLALELLDAYVPASASECAPRDAMRELLATTSAPFDRHQFDPGHFTASAFVASRTDGRVLLIQHPTLGLWLQPGGHVEPSDRSPGAAAVREVREETGLEVSAPLDLFDIDVHVIPARGDAPSHRHFDLRFLVTVEGTPTPSGVEGVTSEWMTPQEVKRWATDHSVHRMLSKWMALRTTAA